MLTPEQRREKLENFVEELSDAIELISDFQDDCDGLWAELKLAARSEPLLSKNRPDIDVDPIIEALSDALCEVEVCIDSLPEDESEDDRPVLAPLELGSLVQYEPNGS